MSLTQARSLARSALGSVGGGLCRMPYQSHHTTSISLPQRLALATEQILWPALRVAGACLQVQRRSAVGYRAGLEATAELLGPSLGGRPSDNSECLCFCETCRTPDCRLKKRDRVEEGSCSLRWCRNPHPTLELGIACLHMSRCTCN